MSRKLRYNDEGDMAKAQLQKIESYAKKINDMIHPEDELEAWVQSKLTRAATDLGDIKHYLDYEISKFADGGIMSDDLKPYQVEFKFDNEDLDVSRLVIIYADSEEEAKELAEQKYSPYYEYFEIVEVIYADGGMTDSDRFKFTFKKDEDYWKARETGYIPDFDTVSVVVEYPNGDELEFQPKTEEEYLKRMKEFESRNVKVIEQYQSQDYFDVKDYGDDDDDYEDDDDDYENYDNDDEN